MMTIFENYQSWETVVYPKRDKVNECLAYLQDAEENNKECINARYKAPTREILTNYLSRRTKSLEYLSKKLLCKFFGYKSIKEMEGYEGD